MKVILSRKGFDNSNGKIPSPIMPDGTLLSLPIPSKDADTFNDIVFNNKTYMQILSELKPSEKYLNCHIDPDLADRRIRKIDGWKPAYGQINQAQSYLENTVNIQVGDVILFFGTFHKVEEVDGKYRYIKKSGDFFCDNDTHIIWGYMQIGEILHSNTEISTYYWHPHSDVSRIDNETNTLYLPSEKLSWNREVAGYGVLKYSAKRVLTLQAHTKATWKEDKVYSPESVIGKRKNSAKGEGIYYSGIWQELGLQESEECSEWTKYMIGEEC